MKALHDLSSTYRPSKNVTFREIAGQTLLLDSIGDEIFSLNDVGAYVFQLVTNGISVADMIERTRQHYRVEYEVAHDDVINFIQSLEEEGFIERVNARPDQGS